MVLPSPVRCFVAGLLLATAAMTGFAADTTPWPTQRWATATPEEVGMSSEALQKLVDFGAASEMDSLLVIRHGRIVAEAYYAPFKAGRRHRINSATKGVTTALIGAAIHAGRLAGPQEPVHTFFPNQADAFADARKRAMRVQHLMDMTSGLDWDEPLSGRGSSAGEMERTRDWVRYVLDRPMKQAPGEAFNYNSGNSQVLSAIVTRATGLRAEKFAVQALFGPLGIVDFDWNVDSTGLSTGGYGLQMTTRDMAKIGYLYLHDGVWDGQRLLPPGWAARPRAAKVAMDIGAPGDFFYADGWWVVPKRGAQMLAGMNRQIILVMPSRGLVVVTTGRTHWRFDHFFDLLEGAVRSDAALPADPKGLRALRAKEEAVARTAAATPASPPAAAAAPEAAVVETRAVLRSVAEEDGGKRVYVHLKLAPGAKLPFTTLRYRVRDPALLAGLQEGASVKFRAERIDGENTLVAIRAVPPCVRFQPCD